MKIPPPSPTTLDWQGAVLLAMVRCQATMIENPYLIVPEQIYRAIEVPGWEEYLGLKIYPNERIPDDKGDTAG